MFPESFGMSPPKPQERPVIDSEPKLPDGLSQSQETACFQQEAGTQFIDEPENLIKVSIQKKEDLFEKADAKKMNLPQIVHEQNNQILFLRQQLEEIQVLLKSLK